MCVVEHGCRQLLGLRNSDGQLGNGTTTDSSVPVAVAAFTDGATAVSITAGNSHTCAVLNTGAVNCWGYNMTGSSATAPPLTVQHRLR